jgi:hypothetical protein
MKNFNVEVKGIRGSFKAIYRACLNTIGKDTDREPSEEWMKRILISEHSPIRKINVEVKWTNLKYWVSTHFVRHKHGIEHFVSTQRTDRTNVDRNELPQGAYVKHEIDVNLQGLINVSRKRLCHCASPETQQVWRKTVDEIAKELPVVKEVCVKECVYRGFCPEFYSCGYHNTQKFREELHNYRKGINGYGTIEQIEKDMEFLNKKMLEAIKE